MPAADRRVLTVLGRSGDDRPTSLDALDARVEIRITDASGLSEALAGAHALLVWDFFSTALREAWPHAGSLEWVHIAAAGVDRLLFDELIDSDVIITNARGIFDRPIAEYVLGAVLSVAKDTYRSHDDQREHVWRHRTSRSVTGATALIVGTGAIGREIARLLRAVGMQVRGAGRTARADDPDFGTVIASADLARHAGWADHLVVIAPLTTQTAGLVDAVVLAAMKPRAHLINVGRGASVVTADLVDALRSGLLAAATLDVFDAEPLAADDPLWTVPGLHVTPHLSGDVDGWRDALAAQFVDNAHRWLAGRPLRNVVDKRLGYPTGRA